MPAILKMIETVLTGISAGPIAADRAEAQELLDLLATAKAPAPEAAHYASAQKKPRKRYHRIKRVRKTREPFIK